MKKCTQLVVSGQMCLPDCKPDIECMLRITAKPVIDCAEVCNRKVVFKGRICMECEYVASVPRCTQPIHFILFELPFNGIINSSCARECMNVQLRIVIRKQELKLNDARSFKNILLVRAGIVRLAKSSKKLPEHICEPSLTFCENCKLTACPPSSCCDNYDSKYDDCHNEKCYLSDINCFDSVQLHDCSDDCRDDCSYETCNSLSESD